MVGQGDLFAALPTPERAKPTATPAEQVRRKDDRCVDRGTEQSISKRRSTDLWPST
jgi:hypothetical protein